MFDVQTRSEMHGTRNFPTLKAAMDHADEDESVWKISFPLPTGERVRLVRSGLAYPDWVYEPVI